MNYCMWFSRGAHLSSSHMYLCPQKVHHRWTLICTMYHVTIIYNHLILMYQLQWLYHTNASYEWLEDLEVKGRKDIRTFLCFFLGFVVVVAKAKTALSNILIIHGLTIYHQMFSDTQNAHFCINSNKMSRCSQPHRMIQICLSICPRKQNRVEYLFPGIQSTPSFIIPGKQNPCWIVTPFPSCLELTVQCTDYTTIHRVHPISLLRVSTPELSLQGSRAK